MSSTARCRTGDPDIVHQHVQASEPAHDLPEQVIDSRRVCHIGHDIGRCPWIDVDNKNRCPALLQPGSDGGTNAGTAAGHERPHDVILLGELCHRVSHIVSTTVS